MDSKLEIEKIEEKEEDNEEDDDEDEREPNQIIPELEFLNPISLPKKQITTSQQTQQNFSDSDSENSNSSNYSTSDSETREQNKFEKIRLFESDEELSSYKEEKMKNNGKKRLYFRKSHKLLNGTQLELKNPEILKKAKPKNGNEKRKKKHEEEEETSSESSSEETIERELDENENLFENDEIQSLLLQEKSLLKPNSQPKRLKRKRTPLETFSTKTSESLVQFLKSVGDMADWSDWGFLDSFSSIGLEVEGIGMIGFPLLEIQVQQLKQKFKKDKNRGAFQIPISQIKFNELFESKSIFEIQEKVQKSFGISNRLVHLQLKNLVLIENDSSALNFSTEKIENGLFAKMFVFLPSIYEGGEITFHNGTEKRSIDLSKQNKYELGWFAFYANCSFRMKSLKSGYRLALMYDICLSKLESNISIPILFDLSIHSDFESIFNRWKQNPEMVGIKLDHFSSLTQRHTQQLSVENLKLDDLSKLNALKTLSKWFAIDVHLATILKTEKIETTTYKNEKFVEREITKSYEIEQWIDLNDQRIPMGAVSIDPKCLYPPHVFHQAQCFSSEPNENEDETISIKLYRLGFLMVWPRNLSRLVFPFVADQSKFLNNFKNAFLDAKKSNLLFSRRYKKWMTVISMVDWLGNLNSKDSVCVLDVLNEIDSVEDPIQRKNTKKFISSQGAISETKSIFISKLEMLISQFGGWSEWKKSIFSLANKIQNPWPILNWMLNSNLIPFHKQEKEEIRELAQKLIQSRPIKPQMCLSISILGNFNLAVEMMPKLLEESWKTIFEKTNPKAFYGIQFSHITSMLQGFGFERNLCEIVQNFLLNCESKQKAAFCVWSMFFQQSSLRRLRIESTKNIVRFGRLIGTNKKLSDRKRAILKLVLNEFASSRLSAKETNELIRDSMYRSTLFEQSSSSPENQILAPFFVQKIFIENYFQLEPDEKIWDNPRCSFDSNLLNDGPSGIGGVSKQTFAKSLYLSIYQFDILQPQIEGVSIHYIFLCFAAYLNDWERFIEVLQFVKEWLHPIRSHNVIQLVDVVVVGFRTFQGVNQQLQLIEWLKQLLGKKECEIVGRTLLRLGQDNLIEKHWNTILELLNDDEFFVSMIDTTQPQEFFSLMNKLAKYSIQSPNTLQSFHKLNSPLSESKLKELIGNDSNLLLNRSIQAKLFQQSNSLENMFCIAKYAVENFPNKQRELSQATKICNFILDEFLEQLFEDFSSEQSLIHSKFRELEFRNIAKFVFHDISVSLGIKLHYSAIHSLVKKLFISASLLGDMLKEGNYNNSRILEFIQNELIFSESSHNPFLPIRRQSVSKWNEWISNSKNEEPLILNEDEMEPESRYFKIEKLDKNSTSIRIFKRWIPYLKLLQNFGGNK